MDTRQEIREFLTSRRARVTPEQAGLRTYGHGPRRVPGVAAEVATALRSEAGRDPYDRALSDLVGELSTRSETFRTLWAAHDVRVHDTGVKRLNHPLVGELELTYETMALTANPGLAIAVFTAEPGSKSEQALNLLASWTATPDEAEPANLTDR